MQHRSSDEVIASNGARVKRASVPAHETRRGRFFELFPLPLWRSTGRLRMHIARITSLNLREYLRNVYHELRTRREEALIVTSQSVTIIPSKQGSNYILFDILNQGYNHVAFYIG